ncbi:26283_t:CDS:2, partial [Gigaspora margarita]
MAFFNKIISVSEIEGNAILDSNIKAFGSNINIGMISKSGIEQ